MIAYLTGMYSKAVFNVITVVENCATVIALIGCIFLQHMPDHLSGHQYLTMHGIIRGMVACILLACILGLLSLSIVNSMRRKGSQDFKGQVRWARWSLLATIFVIMASLLLPVVHS